MIYVAIGALVLALTEGLFFARIIQHLLRAHARREDLLVNQICALAGKPWQPPPARERPVLDPPPVTYASPEQMTEDDLEPAY